VLAGAYCAPGLAMWPAQSLPPIFPLENTAMRMLLLAMIVLLAGVAQADSRPPAPGPQLRDGRVYQTDRYGTRLGQAFVIRGNRVYQTNRYGTVQGQAYLIQGNRVLQTDRYGTVRGPAYVIDRNRVIQTDRYGNRVGDAFVVDHGKVLQTDRYGTRAGHAYRFEPQARSHTRHADRSRRRDR
jgi:hypothetical protein